MEAIATEDTAVLILSSPSDFDGEDPTMPIPPETMAEVQLLTSRRPTVRLRSAHDTGGIPHHVED